MLDLDGGTEPLHGYLVMRPPGMPGEMEVWPTDSEALERAIEMHNEAREKGGAFDGKHSIHRVVMRGGWLAP